MGNRSSRIFIAVLCLLPAVSFADSSDLVAAEISFDRIKMKALISKVHQYQLITNRLPNSLEDLTQAVGAQEQGLASTDDLNNVWGAPYLYDVQVPNQTNSLIPESSQRSFSITSMGRDGKVGGEGPDSDYTESVVSSVTAVPPDLISEPSQRKAFDKTPSKTASVYPLAPCTLGDKSERKILAIRIQNALKDSQRVMSQARVMPRIKDGNVIGLWIAGIKKGSLFQEIGLCSGDLVQQANGSSLNSPDEILKVFDASRPFSEIVIQRKGEPLTLKYLVTR